MIRSSLVPRIRHQPTFISSLISGTLHQYALEDLAWWIQQDRRKALRILRLVQETQAEPFGGIGKPEPLKYELAGCWSKRIDDEHRLVYAVSDECIRILACRYHY